MQVLEVPEISSKLDNTIFIPLSNNKACMFANMICNPYGYYFESPIDAEYTNDNNEPIQVYIPLYVNGEVRLIMKNSKYTTNLPTILLDIEYAKSHFDIIEEQSKLISSNSVNIIDLQEKMNNIITIWDLLKNYDI